MSDGDPGNKLTTRRIRTRSVSARHPGTTPAGEPEPTAARDVPAAAPAEIPGLDPGTRFDRFAILERLGAGGMGVVVAAFDPDLDRKVAIKVLRASAGGTADAEAKAMARLAHPNVVTVYEVGTAGDDVFIVMELVEGETLAAWIERARPWREVVQVMLAAGRGLAAAHAAGIVHRDVKPHNVLLGKDGRVRVTDFGTGAPVVTGDGGGEIAIGTPAYMAPEQHAHGPVDARADQYGFCVSLYEALYGVRPYDGDTPEALRAAVLHGELGPPPADRDVPSWLHEVVVRGLARDPAERYPSMDALLAALANDPARRRRRIAQVVGVVGLAGLAVFGWMRAAPGDGPAGGGVCDLEARSLARVWDPHVAAEVRHAFVAARPTQGLDTYDRAAARLDDYARRWTTAHDAACATRAAMTESAFLRRVTCLVQLRDQLRELVVVFQREADGSVVDRAVTAVANLVPPETCAVARAEPDDPAVNAVRVRVDHLEALTHAGLLQEARALAEDVVADAEALPFPRLHAEAHLALAGMYERLGDGDRAAAALDRTAQAAAAAGADDLLAQAYTQRLWVTAYVQGRSRDALVLQPFAEAAVIRAGNPPALRARLWFAIAAAMIEQGRYDDAVPYLERARDVWQNELDPRHPEAARPLISLGNVANYTGRHDDAVRHYEDALRRREEALGAQHPDLYGPLGNLGGMFNERGDHDRAIAYCTRALAILDATFGPSAPDGDNARRCLAQAHQGKGDLPRARQLLEDAIAMMVETPDTGQSYYLLTSLGDVLAEQGEPARALATCEQALASFAAHVPPDHPDLALGHACRGRALVDLGQAERARQALEQALALRTRGASDVELGTTRFALARALAATDRTRATTLARQALEDYRKANATRRIREVEAWLRASSGTPARRGAAPR